MNDKGDFSGLPEGFVITNVDIAVGEVTEEQKKDRSFPPVKVVIDGYVPVFEIKGTITG